MSKFFYGPQEKCVVFLTTSKQIQAYFKDNSILVIDNKHSSLLYFSHKSSEKPYLNTIFDPTSNQLASENPSAFKRFQILKKVISFDKPERVPSPTEVQPMEVILTQHITNIMESPEKVKTPLKTPPIQVSRVATTKKKQGNKENASKRIGAGK